MDWASVVGQGAFQSGVEVRSAPRGVARAELLEQRVPREGVAGGVSRNRAEHFYMGGSMLPVSHAGPMEPLE